MRRRTRLLALGVGVPLLGLGTLLLVRSPGDAAPQGREIARPAAEQAEPPPVLHGRQPEPMEEPAAPPGESPGRLVELTVRVFDAARERALPGAAVRVTEEAGAPRSVRTNGDGIARLSEVRPGLVDVVARAAGFVRAETTLTLAESPSTGIELRLVRGVTLRGSVFSARTGHAIPGVAVTVAPGGSLDGWTVMSSGSPFGGARTDEQGDFVVDGIPLDELCTVHATAAGYGAASQSLILVPGATPPPPVVLRLSTAAVLTGSVRDRDGNPAVGARVYALPADAPEMLLADPETRVVSNGRPFVSLRGLAGEDGRFEIQGLELGAKYIVLAELEGHGRSERQEGVLATEAAPRPHVALVLQRPASLTVHLLSPAGKPQEEGSLSLFGAGWPLDLEPTAPGRFVAHTPPPGTYTLRVVCPGAVIEELPVTIQASEQHVLEVRLERGLVLAGVLVDDAGQPIAGQKLRASRPWQGAAKLEPSEGEAETDEDGRFRIDGLRKGPHTLGLILGRHVVPEDLRLQPPAEGLRLVVLRKAGFRVRVELPVGHAPPEEVGIRVGRSEDGGTSVSGHTLPWNGGVLRFDDLAPGDCRVHLEVAGLLAVTRELTLGPGEMLDLGTIRMEAGFELEGRVVDREGRPVVGAHVTSGQVWTTLHQEVLTGEDGRFVLPSLARGANEIEIRAPDFLPQTAAVLMPGEARGMEFALDRGALVTVQALETDGSPAPARRVRWRPAQARRDGDDGDWEETDAKGRFTVRLPAGTWVFEVLDDEWQPITSTERTLGEGGTTPLEIQVPR